MCSERRGSLGTMGAGDNAQRTHSASGGRFALAFRIEQLGTCVELRLQRRQ